MASIGQDLGASLMVIPDLHLARLLRGSLAGWGEEQSSWLRIHHAGSIHLERRWGPELSSPPSVWLSGLGSTVKDPRPSLCCPSSLGWMQGEEGPSPLWGVASETRNIPEGTGEAAFRASLPNPRPAGHMRPQDGFECGLTEICKLP